RISACRRLTEVSSRTISRDSRRPARNTESDSQIFPSISPLTPRRRIRRFTSISGDLPPCQPLSSEYLPHWPHSKYSPYPGSVNSQEATAFASAPTGPEMSLFLLFRLLGSIFLLIFFLWFLLLLLRLLLFRFFRVILLGFFLLRLRFFHLDRFEVEAAIDLHIGKRFLQLGHAGVRDFGLPKIQVLEFLHSFKVCQPGVGDCRAIKVQIFQV